MEVTVLLGVAPCGAKLVKAKSFVSFVETIIGL